MSEWYAKLFHRFLNTSILNAMIIHRNNMGKRIDHSEFSYLRDFLRSYANAAEHKVPGRHSSDNTVPDLRQKRFISKIP
jgi:hypothetical protein